MRDLFTFENITSNDFHCYVLDVIEEGTTREYEDVVVAGRNGVLKFDNGRYENVDATYQCAINGEENAAFWINALNDELLTLTGYHRLESSLHPEYYRKGVYAGSMSPSFARLKTGARFDVIFNCMPQKWLKSGEKQIQLSNNSKLVNPTPNNAFPVFELVGNGTITIGGQTITVAGNPDTMIIDCEIGDAYSKAAHTNYNQYVTITGADFPTLERGENNIVYTGFSSVIITPRWWLK